MQSEALLSALRTAEKLKGTFRHCQTASGHPESVAAHSWRLVLLAYFIADEYPNVDMNKVIKMCLIHDLGECFIGDIPSFNKTDADEENEEKQLFGWVGTLPEPYRAEMTALYREMIALESTEARIYKALDNMEAVIQHNESALSSWEENEYALNLTYGEDKAAFSPYLAALRRAVRDETEKKIEQR